MDHMWAKARAMSVMILGYAQGKKVEALLMIVITERSRSITGNLHFSQLSVSLEILLQ